MFECHTNRRDVRFFFILYKFNSSRFSLSRVARVFLCLAIKPAPIIFARSFECVFSKFFAVVQQQ